MSEKNSLSAQLESIVNSVIDPLEAAGVDIISPDHVAQATDKKLDPDSVSPALKTYASMMQIKTIARRVLAKRHDPVVAAEDYAAGASDDLFGGILQLRYPAKRAGADGYVRRELLTETEIAFNSGRMRKAGDSLLQHADALDAWGRSRAS